MAHEFTDKQQKAISSAKDSTAVIAGAGSGKTRVLANRYLEILTNKYADISEIVAITFTEKAASEMNERIVSMLSERLSSCTDDDVKYVENLIERQKEASISTIDAFCKKIVSEYPLEAGCNPYFEIMDTLDVKRRKKSAAKWAVEESLRADDVITKWLIKRDSYRNLISGLMHIYENIRILGVHFNDLRVDDKMLEDVKETEMLSHKCVSEHFKKLLKLMDREYIKLGLNGTKMDFVELEMALIRLLKHDVVGDIIRSKIKYVMVDEYQDINDIQDEIIRLLVKDDFEHKIFVVGDPKQSIYRFRGGNVGLFNELVGEISQRTNGVIDLDTNFRSNVALIKATNYIFAKLFDESFSPSIAGRKDESVEDAMELTIIKSDKNVSLAAELEALYISNYIKEMVSKNEVSYNNIAILLRNTTNLEVFTKVFSETNIPFEVMNSAGLYSTFEVKLVLNLLYSMTDVADDIAFYSTLRSILFNLSDSDILKLRMKNEDKSLFEALMSYETQEGDCDNIYHAKNIIFEFVQSVEVLSAKEYLSKVIRDTSIEAKLAVYDDNAKKLSNLHKFISIASKKAQSISIHELVDELRELSEEADNESEVNMALDAVKIMTIHKSKGLQFPVVFLPQISKTISSFRDYGLFVRNLGLWVRVKTDFFDESDLENDEIAQAVRTENEEQELLEHIRCLYVALTRASERMIMVGSVKGSKKEEAKKDTSWNYMISDALGLEYDIPSSVLHKIDDDTAIKINILNGEELEAIVIDGDAKKGSSIELSNMSFPLLKEVFDATDEYEMVVPVSAFESFSKCDREYVYRYILGIQPDLLRDTHETQYVYEKGLKAVEMGNVFHAVCSRLDGEIQAEEVLISELSKTGEKYNNSDFEHLMKMVKKFESRYRSVEHEYEVLKEEPFMLKLNNLIISGIIDRIHIDRDGEITVIDFKTNNIERSEVALSAKEYQLQMKCYALAVMNRFECDSVVTRLHFMRIDEEYEQKFFASDMNAIEEELITIAGGIDACDLQTAVYTEKEECEKCIYAVLCKGLA